VTVPASELRTALFVRVPADPLVEDFRRRHNASSVARRIPPHVTVLFPFALVAGVDTSLLTRLAEHFSTFPAFEAALGAVGRFEGVVWLAPEPRKRFVELIEATSRAFPAYPPYEGAFAEPEPHLTIGELAEPGDGRLLTERAQAELGARLPFPFLVDAVELYEKLEDGTWRESARFGLG